MSKIRIRPARTVLKGDALNRYSQGLPPDSRAKDEKGATLILALIFIIVISAVAATLTSWVRNDLNNSTQFTNAQSAQSAANSAVESALQTVRYRFTGNDLSAPAHCWTTGTPPGQITINQQGTTVTLAVWCSTVWNPLSTNTRIVTILTCLNTVASEAACNANPLLQAVVVLNDYPAYGTSACIPGTTPLTPPDTCGTGMSIVSWAFGPDPG